MLLNCDLGESFGHWTMGSDALVMPHIDQANIACGFHAGDPLTLSTTLSLAAQHGVAVGAHPAYPDLAGFGRRSMALTSQELIANLHYQMGAVEGMAYSQGLTLGHIKPHGALYNDMMKNTQIRSAILQAVADYHRPLTLIMQATEQADRFREEAQSNGVELMFEAFADRCYDDDGSLLHRSQHGAVLDQERMLAQVAQLCQDHTVTTVSGAVIQLQAQTLCIHGDNPGSVQAIKAIRALVAGG
jgi:UPF0271 protein